MDKLNQNETYDYEKDEHQEQLQGYVQTLHLQLDQMRTRLDQYRRQHGAQQNADEVQRVLTDAERMLEAIPAEEGQDWETLRQNLDSTWENLSRVFQKLDGAPVYAQDQDQTQNSPTEVPPGRTPSGSIEK